MRYSAAFHSTDVYLLAVKRTSGRSLVRKEVNNVKEVAPALPPKDRWKILMVTQPLSFSHTHTHTHTLIHMYVYMCTY